jgi:acyl-CoA synthetase (AMP-forming)/AMP-acid ligase II
VEAAALHAGKPRAQGCAAFKLATGGQRFGLCVEIGLKDSARAEDLARTIRSAVSGELGTRVAPLLVVIPGAIPRTTSGKVQRGLTRSLHQSGKLSGHKVFAELP